MRCNTYILSKSEYMKDIYTSGCIIKGWERSIMKEANDAVATTHVTVHYGVNARWN